MLGNLKRKLKTLHDLNADDRMIKDAVLEAIRKSTLDDIDSVKDGLSKIHKNGLISKVVFGWAICELTKQRNLLAPQEIQDDTLTFHDCKPIELDKDLLYHSSLCSMAVNNYDTAGCVKLFQSLSRKTLKKLSISECQNEKEFPKCLIAENSDQTCFVAFESYLDFRFWDKMSAEVPDCTFGKGMYSLHKIYSLSSPFGMHK